MSVRGVDGSKAQIFCLQMIHPRGLTVGSGSQGEAKSSQQRNFSYSRFVCGLSQSIRS